MNPVAQFTSPNTQSIADGKAEESLSKEALRKEALSKELVSKQKLSQEKLSQETLSQEKLSQETLSQEKLSEETLATHKATAQQANLLAAKVRAAQADAGKSAPSALVRGRALERTGNWSQAAKVYELAIRENPNQWELLHRWGVVADRQKQHVLAQQCFSQAIQLNPTNAQLFNDLGSSFYLQGELAKAEDALGKAVMLAPNEMRIRNNLGMVLGNQDRMEEAFAQFSKAGSDADAYYSVALIYASNKNHQAAGQCFQMALQADPQHAKSHAALAALARGDDPNRPAPNAGHLARREAQPATPPEPKDDLKKTSGFPQIQQVGAAISQLFQGVSTVPFIGNSASESSAASPTEPAPVVKRQ